jgi:heptosyltransferase-2
MPFFSGRALGLRGLPIGNVKKPQRILVVRTDRIGDVVLATPLIRALRQTFPSAYIAAFVRPYARDLLLHNPHLNDILIDDPAGEHSGRKGFWNQVSLLRRHRFDTALLLLPTERLAWMLFFAGIRTRVGVGTVLYEVLTFMKTVSRRKYIPLRHEADYCMDLGRVLGVASNDLSTELFLTASEKEEGQQLIRPENNGDEIFVGIHPGSGHSSPNWQVERYVEFAAAMLEHRSVRIVVTGSTQESALTSHFNKLGSERVTNLIGQLSLRQLMGVISHLQVLVSSSTGPMHIAAALKVLTVSMFCPLTACSPVLWGPKGNATEILLAPESYCTHQCPGDPHVCDFEGGIGVQEVHNAVLRSINHP